MNHIYSKLKRKFRKFNREGFTFEDVTKICKRERIKIAIMPLPEKVKGYYTTELRTKYRKKCIVLNSRLSLFERLIVALHELVHHFFHVSMQRKQTFYCRIHELNDSKQDVEAEAMSLIMMIPKKDLFEYEQTPFEDLNPLLIDLLIKRKALYEKFTYLEEH